MYTINARRWFDKINGNTYHSVTIYDGNKYIARNPFSYGYDEHYKVTAMELLQKRGLYPIKNTITDNGVPRDFYDFWKYWSKKNCLFLCTDVARKKDL